MATATLNALPTLPPLLLAGVLALAGASTAGGQIVNVERLRLDRDGQGWVGAASANFDLQRNQRSVLSLRGKAHLQLRRDSNATLLFGEAGVVSASDRDLVNFAVGHLRHTRRLTDGVYAEAFTQLQQNRVNGIASRWLVGAGPRFRLARGRPVTAYLGTLVMREREREVTDSIPLRRHWRASVYLAASYTPRASDWVTVATTTYLQPRLGTWDDVRVATDWSVQVRLRENLSLVTSLNLVYDARPPLGLDRATYALLNGLKVRFG